MRRASRLLCGSTRKRAGSASLGRYTLAISTEEDIPDIRALVAREQASDKMELAETLASAKPGQFLHVDPSGRVRSVVRYKALAALRWTFLGASTVGVGALYVASFGWGVGLAVGAGLSLWAAYWFGRRKQITRAAVLSQTGKAEEALGLLERQRARPLQPRVFRALIALNLAGARARLGQREEALVETDRAILLARGKRKLRLYYAMALHQQILLLAGLGRLREAQTALDNLPPLDSSADYLRVGRWFAELFVQFMGKRCTLSDEALHERARFALGATSSAPLLAVLAWARHARGEEEAGFLAEQARERIVDRSLFGAVPELLAWLDAYADQRMLTA